MLKEKLKICPARTFDELKQEVDSILRSIPSITTPPYNSRSVHELCRRDFGEISIGPALKILKNKRLKASGVNA
jgi:hypothetical protein